MTNYLVRRLLNTIPLLFVISMITFSIMKLAPGDPTAMYFNPEKGTPSPEQVEILRHNLGLDRPIYVQYANWLLNTLRGDLGFSLRYKSPVSFEIFARLPNTLLLGGVAIMLTLLISIPIGAVSAIKRHSIFDYVTTLLAYIGISMPGFWVALILMYVVSFVLGWLPSVGMQTLGGVKDWGAQALDVAKHLVLPAISLSLAQIAFWVRYQRSALLDVLNQDYVRTARAKGLKENKVIWKHAFRNSLIPMVTLLGLTLPDLVAGAYMIETIFGWPGMGRLGVEAIVNRDYPVIMGVTMFSALIVIFSNLLADMLYAIVDPRIHQG